MKIILKFLTVIIIFCSCKKDTEEENGATIIYKNVSLSVPVTTAFVYKFEIQQGYVADLTFSYYKVGNVYTVKYENNFASFFQCNGINNFIETKKRDSLIVPNVTNNVGYKFLEVTINGSTITYPTTTNIKFDQEVYVPFYYFLDSSQTLPCVGWMRVKCTSSEFYIYDLAFRKVGEIKAGEK